MAAHASRTVIYAALVGNAAIAVTKFAAAGFTGSAAMMSEAIHSTVDTGNQLLLLYGLRQAGRPATPELRYGQSTSPPLWAQTGWAARNARASVWPWTAALLLGLCGRDPHLRNRRRPLHPGGVAKDRGSAPNRECLRQLRGDRGQHAF